MDDSLKTRGL